VELSLDAEDNVVDRRAIPYPYPTRDEAVEPLKVFFRDLLRRLRGRERFLVGQRRGWQNTNTVHNRRGLNGQGRPLRATVLRSSVPVAIHDDKSENCANKADPG